ncbi:PilN domain-containing protein [Neptuniibacter sp.]|uniref:PilN domain-containing protein n=1 Tax=Neptuniibacter sp. TaxID=1962643 RepID=UPI003B5D0584
MATINLRPWREEQSSLRQKQFGANVIGSIVFAVIVVFLVGYYFDEMKNRQNERNDYLKVETAKLDKQIKEIKDLKLKRERLLERLNAIQQLQGSRPLIVRNFDELVRVLPDRAYYNSLSRKGDKVSISGSADENLDVSSLMRNLNQSIWFGEPQLSRVDSKGTKKTFSLSVGVVKPKAEELEGK